MKKFLHILQHSLGLDQYGRGTAYRNHFATAPGSDDFETCAALCDLGLMLDRGVMSFTGTLHCFIVTQLGVEYVSQNSPKPPKLSRSKQRYLDYLQVADCFESFSHYLKHKEAERRESFQSY